MQFKKPVILLFIICSLPSFGRDAIDSLQNLLNTSTGASKIEIYISLIQVNMLTNSEKALEYAFQGEKLALEIGNLELMAKIKTSQGAVYYQLNELNLSDEAYFEALNLFDSAGIEIGKARVLGNIGWNYKVREMLDEALVYYNQSLAIAREANDPMILQMILNNLGTVYRNQGRYQEALAIFNESLELNMTLGNQRWEAYNFNNMGLVYMDSGQYAIAIKYIRRAADLNIKNEYNQEYSRNVLNLGATFTRMQMYDSAGYYLDLAGNVIDQHQYKREKLDYFGRRRDLYESMNDYKRALEYDKLYHAHNAELNQLAWNEKVSALQVKYEIAQKDRALEASARKVNQQKFVILAISATSFFLMILLFLFVRMYKDRSSWARNVERLNDEINDKNTELEAMNEQIRSINNDLEQTVKNRAEKILDQNEKLIRYAFINSHEVRGPLARMLGLLYLISLENNNIKENTTFRLLMESTNELDQMIKKASELLENEDFFKEG